METLLRLVKIGYRIKKVAPLHPLGVQTSFSYRLCIQLIVIQSQSLNLIPFLVLEI